MHSLFTFKSLQSFILVVSTMLKECLYVYFSSALDAAGRRTSLLRAYSLLLTDICRDSGTEFINGRFSEDDISADLNGFFTNDGTRCMLKGKDIDQLDSALPFVATSVDRAIGKQHRYPMKHVDISFSNLRQMLNCRALEHVQAL